MTTDKTIQEYVSINGIQQYFLHIPSSGSNEVIIMLHGGPGIPNSYLAYYHQPHTGFCNVVYYDQRGAGKTQLKNKTKPDSITLDVLIEDLHQTVLYIKERYSTKRIFLVCHSCGSMLGTQYLIKHPCEVAGYIGYGQMVDSMASDKCWYDYLKSTVNAKGIKSDVKKLATVDERFPNLQCEDFVKSTLILTGLEGKYGFKAQDYVKLYQKSPTMTLRGLMQMVRMSMGCKMSRHLLGQVFYGQNIRSHVEYQVPIYFILGRYDKWTSSTITADYFETIRSPEKKLYWIENAGHMVDTDNPAAFFEAVKDILMQ